MRTTVNELELNSEIAQSIIVGPDRFCRYLTLMAQRPRRSGKPLVLFLESFPGVDWELLISRLEEAFRRTTLKTHFINGETIYKPPDEIENLIEPYLGFDKYFGRIYEGDIYDFIDSKKAVKLRDAIRDLQNSERKSVIICFGSGIFNKFVRKFCDFLLYIDLTREKFYEIIQRRPPTMIRLKTFLGEGVADAGLSVDAFKLAHYIYFPVFDKQRRYVLKHLDYYVEGDSIDEIKLIPRKYFMKIIHELARRPIRLKPIYIPSPWGGQWIKRLRRLPEKLINCAWAFEAVAPEMSLIVKLKDIRLKIPFVTLLTCEYENIVGREIYRRFKGFFPIRVHYDDSFEGGNMAIQVHPDNKYIKENFNEPIGQHESYYIVHVKNGAKVFLGLRDGIDIEDFRQAVLRAERYREPFDYEKYVNSFKSEVGDLFLIPAGTVHALGKDQVCVEIGTSYGYTFHIYDYLRPGLNGKLRPIHAEHAFKAIKFKRVASWVSSNLRQKPKVLRRGRNWVEYLLGRFREIPYEVRRLDFKEVVEDSTYGRRFHILVLVEGKALEIIVKRNPSRRMKINFSEAVIIPVSVRRYILRNLGDVPCKVLKVLLKGRSRRS